LNFPLYIAKRYLRSKSSNNAINFITNIAIIGIILGAASLFIVLAGFAGLKDFTLQFSTEIDPDLKAETTIGKNFVLTPEMAEKLDNLEAVAEYSKIIEERVFITSNNKTTIAKIKGVDAQFQNIVNIDSAMDTGSWVSQNTNEIVVGWGIANHLSLGVLDFTKSINIYVPKPGKGQITSTKDAFNSVRAVNVGVFYINETLNDGYIYAPIALAKKLLNYQENQISALEFKMSSNADETQAKQSIQAILGN